MQESTKAKCTLSLSSLFLSFTHTNTHARTHTRTFQSLAVPYLCSILNPSVTSVSLLFIDYFPKFWEFCKRAVWFPAFNSTIIATFYQQTKNSSYQLSSSLPLHLTNTRAYITTVLFNIVVDKSICTRIRIRILCTINTQEFIPEDGVQGRQKDLMLKKSWMCFLIKRPLGLVNLSSIVNVYTSLNQMFSKRLVNILP